MRIAISEKEDADGCAELLRLTHAGIDICDIKVFLDGKQEHACVVADSDVGLVIRWAKDANGQFREDANGEIAKELVYGNVEIRLPGTPVAAMPDETADFSQHLRF